MTPEKISEFTLPEDAVLALGAIYRDAYEHGHRVGLSFGLAEKAIIDEGAWYSYDEGVARWAGCTLPTLESMG